MKAEDLEKKLQHLMKMVEVEKAARIAAEEKLLGLEAKEEEHAAKVQRDREIGRVRSAYNNESDAQAVTFAKKNGYVADDAEIRRALELAGYDVSLLDVPKKRIVRRK